MSATTLSRALALGREEIPMRLEQGVPERPLEFATPAPMTGAAAEELPTTATPYGPPMGPRSSGSAMTVTSV